MTFPKISPAIHAVSEAEEAKRRAVQDERERVKYMRMANKFKYGGLVTVGEADKYLGLDHGTLKLAYDAGKIKGRARSWGKDRLRVYVDAADARLKFGIPAESIA